MRTGAMVTLMAVGCGVALAGPARFDHVDGGAQWVLHIDLEQASHAELGQWFLHHIDEQIAEDEIASSLRGDLRWGQDVHGVTLYGWEDEGEDDESIVAVVYGSASLDKLEERLWHGHAFLHGDDEPIKAGGHKVMVLGEDDDQVNVIAMRAGNERVFLASPKLEWLKRAAKVMDGDRDALGGGAPILELSSPPEGAMAVVVATDLSRLSGFKPASEIARQADAVFGSLSERDGKAHVSVAVSAETEEDASSIADVVRGLVALGRLIASDQPDVQPLVEMTRGLKFSAEGRMVRGSLSVDAGKVREFLEEHEHDRDDDDQGDDDDD
ncbi:MAG: hypothetical protein R3B57_06950 [Phycisphaerales bacterium]